MEYVRKVDIGEGATLDVDIESSIKEATGIASESYKDFIVQKKWKFKSKKTIFIGTINSGDIF